MTEHLKIDKFPVYVASGAGVIGFRIAIQHPEKVKCLLTGCATSGSYTHSMIPMFETNDGRAMYEWPSIARLGSKFAPKFTKAAIAGDLMTANNQKKGTYTQAEADAIAAEKDKDPRMAYLPEVLPAFMTMGPLYPESWDTMLVDLQYYKDEIPFE